MKRDPHYWLQYAMAKMMLKDYPTAEKFLESAYSYAAAMNNYDTSYLDIQKAKLLLLKSMEEQDGAVIHTFFNEAHNLLLKQDDDVFKYRQVSLYKDFYMACYNKMAPKHRVKFEHACKSMKKSLSSIYVADMAASHSYRTLRGCYEGLDTTIQQIASARI